MCEKGIVGSEMCIRKREEKERAKRRDEWRRGEGGRCREELGEGADGEERHEGGGGEGEEITDELGEGADGEERHEEGAGAVLETHLALPRSRGR